MDEQNKYVGKRCAKCGEQLTAGSYTEFDQPMTRYNPYPESIVVCNKTECLEAAQQWTEDNEKAVAEQEEEDDYEE